MEIRVDLYGMWRDIGGAKRLVLTLPVGATVADLVRLLSERWGEDIHKLLVAPATGELWSPFAIAVNDALIHSAVELSRELHANDRVSFFHPVTGGA